MFEQWISANFLTKLQTAHFHSCLLPPSYFILVSQTLFLYNKLPTSAGKIEMHANGGMRVLGWKKYAVY